MVRDHNEVFPEIEPISGIDITILNNENNINIENTKTLEAVECQHK